MSKPIRTPLNQEQLADAERLKKAYLSKVAESKAKGEKPTLNQSEVGAKCGWNSPQSTVSQYLNGKVALNLDALLKLAEALDIQPWEISPTLAGGLKRVASSSTASQNATAANTPFPGGGDIEAAEDKYAFIPQYSAMAAAGDGHDNPHVEIRSTLAFKKEWLRIKGVKAENLQVIYANGNSMWPTISDHDVLLVDNSKVDPVDNGVFVVESVNDGTLVKRLAKGQFGNWTLRSDNIDRDQYPDRSFLRSESNEHRIIGRVIWRGGDL